MARKVRNPEAAFGLLDYTMIPEPTATMNKGSVYLAEMLKDLDKNRPSGDNDQHNYAAGC